MRAIVGAIFEVKNNEGMKRKVEDFIMGD